jgi:hypothetical protein
MQLEFAKRLSQGLSVSNKVNSTKQHRRLINGQQQQQQHLIAGPGGLMTTIDTNIQYSVVLDPQEYVLNPNQILAHNGTFIMTNNGIMNNNNNNNNNNTSQATQYQLQYQQEHQELLWPSTKASRYII